MKLCHGVHKAAFGQRMLWLECGLQWNHEEPHYDFKRKFSWSGPVFLWDEFEHGTAGLAKVKRPKRKRTKTETKDLLVKRGAKFNLMAQHREEQRWKFLERTTLTQPRVEQMAIPMQLDDPDMYYGEF